MLFLYLLQQIVAASIVAFAVAAPDAAEIISLGLTKRDRPPPGGLGGDPEFFPFPTTNSEWPCESGGLSRASCMFGTLPTSTSTPPAVSSIWVQPVPSPTFTPTVFDPHPGKTKTVTGPHKTKTVTVDNPITVTVTAEPTESTDELIPTATWTQTATWTEVATWTETLLGSAPTEVPSSESEEEAESEEESESEEASEQLVERALQVMTKNSRRVKFDTMALAGPTITAEGDPIFTILPVTSAGSTLTTEAEPMFTILPMPEVNSGTMTAGPALPTGAGPILTILPMPDVNSAFISKPEISAAPTFTTEAEPMFTILPMPEVDSETVELSAPTFTTEADPLFTILPVPDVNSRFVPRHDEQVCISACKFDTDQPTCYESCNKDLVSFTQAYCKDYAPSCVVDKESEQCIADCAFILPEGNACGTGCYKSEDVEGCEDSCAQDLDTFRDVICSEHGCE